MIARITPFIIFCLATLAMTAQAAWPPEFRAVYQLHKFGMNAAEATVSLEQQANGNMLYKSQSETRGLVSMFRDDSITETSVLEKTAGILRPIQYRYIHKGGKKNRNQSIDFDYNSNKANSNYRGNIAAIEFNGEVFDNFSMQLKLMHDLHEGKTTLDTTVITKGRLKPYHFEIEGTETIETDAGNFEAVKLKRVRNDGKRTTYMWMARKLHYLPIKIQHIEKDGTDFSLELDKVSGAITQQTGTTPKP